MIPGIAPAIVLRTGAADPLAEYYGSGDGDIVIDWDFSDADTVSVNGSNEITAVVNKGGWGSSYDLGGTAGKASVYDADGFALVNGARSWLRIGATTLNLYGLHAMASITGEQAAVLSAAWDTPTWMIGGQFSYSRTINNIIGKSYYPATALGVGNLIEYEARIDSAAASVGLRGAGSSYSQSFTGSPSAAFTTVGANYNKATPDRIRRIVLVKQDSAYDMDDPEPAVLAARAWLEADADAYNDGL